MLRTAATIATLCLIVTLVTPSTIAKDISVAESENAVCMVVGDATNAKEVLQRIDRMREMYAPMFIGRHLDTGEGYVDLHINVEGRAEVSSERMLLENRRNGRPHMVFIDGTDAEDVNGMIGHAVIQSILIAEHGVKVPRWIVAGASSMADDKQRKLHRLNVLSKEMGAGRSPSIEHIASAQSVRSDADFAFCESLVLYLIHTGGHEKFAEFVGQATKNGTKAALTGVYGESVDQDWRMWSRDLVENYASK